MGLGCPNGVPSHVLEVRETQQMRIAELESHLVEVTATVDGLKRELTRKGMYIADLEGQLDAQIEKTRSRIENLMETKVATLTAKISTRMEKTCEAKLQEKVEEVTDSCMQRGLMKGIDVVAEVVRTSTHKPGKTFLRAFEERIKQVKEASHG